MIKFGNRMIKFVFYSLLICLIMIAGEASAQESGRSVPSMLEDRIWKTQLSEDELCVEFRHALSISTPSHDGARKKADILDEPDGQNYVYAYLTAAGEGKVTLSSPYTLCGDTVKIFRPEQSYVIMSLTDSTLSVRRLSGGYSQGENVMHFTTDNSLSGRLANEKRLDRIWRREDVWRKGVTLLTGEPVRSAKGMELPRWANWRTNLDKYFQSQMRYPEHLLKENKAGCSVVMLAIDTLGLPGSVDILTSTCKEFDDEVVRLVKELPHALPCRDSDGRRVPCLYTVYVPFLPQHYRDRVMADSLEEVRFQKCCVHWEEQPRFLNGSPQVLRDYIQSRLVYDPSLLGEKESVRGTYLININEYGELTEVKTLSSCGIPEWDTQVLGILRSMPRWTPAMNHFGKGQYKSSRYFLPATFRKSQKTQ